jgi:alpha/beta superfamily hydrolase
MTQRDYVTIPAPEGSLEGLLVAGTRAEGPALLLCHPHPQYGGSLDDGVLDVTAGAWSPHVADILRFNFRGVGGSSGSYDGGRGEVSDVETAAAWLAGGAAPLWLGGYSFGSAMAWQSLRSLSPARVLLISPPVGAMTYPHYPGLSARVDVITGDRDAFVDLGRIEAWAGRAARDVHLHVVAGADHFFMGRQGELARLLRSIA